MKIKNVVVIGSGTMGSGIAAHLCNANIPVTLLDLKTEISENARERIHKSRPPLLIDKSKIKNIKVGNIEDDFSVVEQADWVVEAVVERIDIKHQIYEKIFKSRKDGAIVSSNTSSIPIKVLSQNLDKEQNEVIIKESEDKLSMLNINLNEVKENSIEIRERKASSAATIDGLNKRRLDLLERIENELNLNENNILEFSNLELNEEFPDAVTSRGLKHIKELLKAKKEGYDEVIYLDSVDGQRIEELCSANLFICKDGVIKTPKLSGSILDGVTRNSVCRIAKDVFGIKVEETDIRLDELLEADEVFCTGTAVIVNPIGSITKDDNKISLFMSSI